MSIEYINNRIKNEICHDTINMLKDENLMNEYKNCNSVKNEINKLNVVLEKNLISNDAKDSIVKDYLLELIPAGTKGVIRGNKFNHLVKEYIEALNLDKDQFDVCFEKKCDLHLTTEIPDWYIHEREKNKIIIGMNQLDLWGGGQQLNRGFKYLENNKHNTENSKLVCVVCNEIQFKSEKNKAYKLFETGFKNDTLCYLKNLKNIIQKYF
jgi:hypothetical protein